MTRSAGWTRCRSRPICTSTRSTSWRSTRKKRSSRPERPGREGPVRPGAPARCRAGAGRATPGTRVSMTVLAIIVAAGRGVRMGADRPKAFLRLRGLTLLERSIGVFVSHPGVERVVAAVPDPGEAARVLGPPHGKGVLVPRGATRQGSVGARLHALTPRAGQVNPVHAPPRPLGAPQGL